MPQSHCEISPSFAERRPHVRSKCFGTCQALVKSQLGPGGSLSDRLVDHFLNGASTPRRASPLVCSGSGLGKKGPALANQGPTRALRRESGRFKQGQR